MKIKTSQTLLSAILLGGILYTAGCSSPRPLTIAIGAPTKPERSVVCVSSMVPAKVQCVWQQDGAGIQHRGTTPFRLVLPANSVHEISFTKPDTATTVAVEIRLLAPRPSRFAMERGSSGLRLVRDARGWESFELGS